MSISHDLFFSPLIVRPRHESCFRVALLETLRTDIINRHRPE